MNNILFLDFDGPLFPYNSTDPYQKIRGNWPAELTRDNPFLEYWTMDKEAVIKLNTLKEIKPFITVISSGWKDYVSLEDIKTLFKLNGLNMDIHPTDPIAKDKSETYFATREDDILAWLGKNCHIENYLVLDDPNSGVGLWDTNRLKNVFLVDPFEGIDEETYQAMIEVVENWE